MNEFSVGNSGPEGIRTPGLLSAIEARSQLRYRPNYKAKDILLEADRDVKHAFHLPSLAILQTFYIFLSLVVHPLSL